MGPSTIDAIISPEIPISTYGDRRPLASLNLTFDADDASPTANSRISSSSENAGFFSVKKFDTSSENLRPSVGAGVMCKSTKIVFWVRNRRAVSARHEICSEIPGGISSTYSIVTNFVSIWFARFSNAERRNPIQTPFPFTAYPRHWLRRSLFFEKQHPSTYRSDSRSSKNLFTYSARGLSYSRSLRYFVMAYRASKLSLDDIRSVSQIFFF